MKRVLFLLTALTATGIVAQTTRPAAKTKIEVVGLQITKPDLKDEMGSMVPGRLAGTSLHVKVSRQDKYFLNVDEKASRLVAFADDKKTDLSKSTGRRFSHGWLGGWGRISDDGHHCVLEIRSDSTPAPGAKELRLKADVVMLCGRDEKTAEQKGFALKEGSKLTVGPVPWQVKSVEEGGWGETKMTLRLTAKVGDDAIKELKFLGPDGKEVKHDVTGSAHWGFAEDVTYEKTLGLAEKLDQVTVRVTYFDKVEKLTVPLEIGTGVGF